MVSRSSSLSSIFLLAILALFGCEKDSLLGTDIAPDASARIAKEAACSSFQYADSVLYYRDETPDYAVAPQNSRKGTYGAFPDGLVIDPATGAIDVNKSESGLKYRVWFKAKGSKDTCTTYVAISGINYRSRIYNLNAGDITATPFYNGQSNLTCPCADAAKNTKRGSLGCEFANDNDPVVVTKMAGRSKKPVGVEIDETGAINLRNAVANGVFGEKPVNGTVQTFRLFYRLNDASKKSLNYIDVRLHYYSSLSAVPANLMTQASVKTYATFRQATPVTPTVGMMNSESDAFESDSKKPRPPDIIIVGN